MSKAALSRWTMQQQTANQKQTKSDAFVLRWLLGLHTMTPIWRWMGRPPPSIRGQVGPNRSDSQSGSDLRPHSERVTVFTVPSVSCLICSLDILRKESNFRIVYICLTTTIMLFESTSLWVTYVLCTTYSGPRDFFSKTIFFQRKMLYCFWIASKVIYSRS